jgi:hypothetical protein
MKILLHSGEYYDYYSIKQVIIKEGYIVTIKGNTEKGHKAKETTLFLDMIKNQKEFKRFLDEEMNVYVCEGKCPFCNSLNIIDVGNVQYIRELNRVDAKTKYGNYDSFEYRCLSCKTSFSPSGLKHIDVVYYYP